MGRSKDELKVKSYEEIQKDKAAYTKGGKLYRSCFARSTDLVTGKPGCMALQDAFCLSSGTCNFYKTKEKHLEDRAKADARLKRLGISNKK